MLGCSLHFSRQSATSVGKAHPYPKPPRELPLTALSCERAARCRDEEMSQVNSGMRSHLEIVCEIACEIACEIVIGDALPP